MRLRLPVLLFAVVALCGCTKKPKLKAVRPVKADVEATVSTISSGTVEAEKRAVLNFGVTGRVASISVKAGDAVREGDTIAQLDNVDLKTIFQDAVKERERAEQLFAEKLVARVALDEARKAVDVARANLDRSVLRAPFDGVVTEVNLNQGEVSGPQTQKVPVRLIDEKPRLVRGDIDEIDLAKVHPGQPARVRIPAARTEAFAGQVTRVVPFVDTTKEQDRTSQIELKLPRTDKLIPVGASAEIEIVTGTKKSVLALPTRVVLGSGKERYVYRVNGGKLERAKVELGMGNYERTEVLSGVGESDLVVYPSEDVELKAGLAVETEPVAWP